LHNSDFAVFDFRSQNNNGNHTNSTTATASSTASVECVSLHARLTVFHGERPFDLIESYTRLYSGRMDPLPAWSMEGAVVGVQGGEQRVFAVLDQLKEWGVPVAAVWYVFTYIINNY
jgi:alpha-glucosidase (family GH31 glycosyl hydrolase)